MAKPRDLKSEGTTIYYRDLVDGSFQYVKGTVLDFKSIRDAEKDWDQKWSAAYGTILKINAEDSRVQNREKPRFRRLNTVLSEEQFKRRSKAKVAA